MRRKKLAFFNAEQMISWVEDGERSPGVSFGLDNSMNLILFFGLLLAR